jgi:hypothetical protein
VAISRSRNAWIDGSSCSCSQIQSLNGSSFDPAGAREQRGGEPELSARRIVLRCSPCAY